MASWAEIWRECATATRDPGTLGLDEWPTEQLRRWANGNPKDPADRTEAEQRRVDRAVQTLPAAANAYKSRT